MDRGQELLNAAGPAPAEPARPRFRALFDLLYRRPGLRLALLLGPPLAWMVVVYLGSLASLLVSAFWRLDPLTSTIQHAWGLQNFATLWQPTYRAIALRTVGFAAAVTVVDVALAFPIAYYTARIARPRTRAALLVLMILPLWASYLVRVFAWRTILANGGLLSWLADRLHAGNIDIGYSNWAVLIVFCYLWLPYVVLPITTALDRVPDTLLDASADLGARAGTTFRRVVLPLALPGVAAGSIFSFSLTLGDYITPALAGNTQFVGNVIFDNVGIAGNVPLAAAFAFVPIVVMIVYLGLAKRLGAFDAL